MNCKTYTVKVYTNRTEWFNEKGQLHRLDGPAREWADGNKEWFVEGKLHRLDGPAAEYADGSKYWYVEGKLHRLDGPACEWADGDKSWYVEGKCHRLDGPAVEYANGSKVWYVEGKYLTEEEFNNRNSCVNKVVIIDGQEYQLVLKR